MKAPADCDETSRFLNSFEAGYPLPDFPYDYVDTRIFSDPVLLSLTKEYYRSLALYCESPTKANLVDMSVARYKVDSETCRVHTRSFRQEFKLDHNGDWISVSGPDGWCGDITVSSLKMDRNSSSLWVYTTKEISTTEKRDELCGPPDPTEYIYNWKRDSYALQCRAIKFGL